MSLPPDGELTPVDIGQQNRAQSEPTDSPSERTPEQRSRDMDICVAAYDHCADATDRVAAEDEYVVSHGGDLELMRLIREQARTVGPVSIVFVPDPRVAELQVAYAQATYQRFETQLNETREQIKTACEKTVAKLHEEPGYIESLHAASEVGPSRTFLQLAARGSRIDANANRQRLDIALERILRGVLDALDAGDVDRLEKIARVAEPKQRDMHATRRSEMRTGELRNMHSSLCIGLAKLWGLITVDELVAHRHEIANRYGIASTNAERGARAEMEAFRAAPAAELARVFVGTVELIPEVFADHGVEFSTESRYNDDGVELAGPDPGRVEAVAAAYERRIDKWEATRDEETIHDRAVDLIEEGLVALGMDRKRGADSLVSFLRKQKDRATAKEARAKDAKREPEDAQP